MELESVILGLEPLTEFADGEQLSSAEAFIVAARGLARTIDAYGLSVTPESRLSLAEHDEHDDSSGTSWLLASEIASKLNIYDRWVYRAVKEFSIETEVRYSPVVGYELPSYPPTTLPILKAELDWQRAYRDLDKLLIKSQIVELVGRSYGWTAIILDSLGVKPDRIDVYENKEHHYYHKRVIKNIRRINMTFPFDDGWFNLGQLSELGYDREWAEKRLLEAGLQPKIRRSALTGKLLWYYDPVSPNVLEAAVKNRPPAAGDWLTAEAITDYVGRNFKWVKLRLKQYEDTNGERQDDNAVPRMHYPFHVAAALKVEAETIAAYETQGDLLTFSDLRRITGKSGLWLKNRLPLTNIEPIQRQDGKQRLRPMYPSDVLRALSELPADFRTSSRS